MKKILNELPNTKKLQEKRDIVTNFPNVVNNHKNREPSVLYAKVDRLD